jgi:peroxiredoxin
VQLVELQAAWPDLDRAGAAVYAISYDTVAVLAEFAQKRGITFPLLSDEGSRVIRELGLLNEHLDEQQAAYGLNVRDDQRGVAYPGTFVLDSKGIVTAKYFEQSYRARPTATLFRELILGAGLPATAPVALPASESGVQVRAWSDALTYRPYQQLRVHVQLDIPSGSHVYAEPIPDGYTPISVEIQPREGLTVESPILPAAHDLHVPGLGEDFYVYDDRMEVVIPFLLTSNFGAIQLDLQVKYQVCPETTCFPPTQSQVALPLEGLDLIRD